MKADTKANFGNQKWVAIRAACSRPRPFTNHVLLLPGAWLHFEILQRYLPKAIPESSSTSDVVFSPSPVADSEINPEFMKETDPREIGRYITC